MPSKHKVRVALTRTAVGHWERYFSYVAPIENELRQIAAEHDSIDPGVRKVMANLGQMKDVYYAQLCGAPATTSSCRPSGSSVARCSKWSYEEIPAELQPGSFCCFRVGEKLQS